MQSSRRFALVSGGHFGPKAAQKSRSSGIPHSPHIWRLSLRRSNREKPSMGIEFSSSR
jgi:hypothetical protein